MNGGDTSVPVDHKRGGQRFQAAVLIARFVVAQHHTIIDFSFRDKGIDRLPAVIVHRDAEDFEASVFVFTLELREPRDLDHARATPGCPKIEQHHLATIIGKVNQLAVRVLQSKIGRVFALAVVLNDRPDRARRRARDQTENRGDDRDGRQTQMGSQALHLPDYTGFGYIGKR
jgi:hypothetical protein